MSLEKNKVLHTAIFFINVSLNYKIPFVFYNLKNYDAHLIMQKKL